MCVPPVHLIPTPSLGWCSHRVVLPGAGGHLMLLPPTSLSIRHRRRSSYPQEMALDLQLLGQPAITRDGLPVSLSGRKPWGLLAFLLLEPHPTRREVASRLVPEANDPLAALRWLLHQVRRAIEPEGTIVELDGRWSFGWPTR